MNASQPYTEHLVSHQASNISVRHYAGPGPAFVLMHGFPDNLHISDRLIPALHGRQVITFDFLGWGAGKLTEGLTNFSLKGETRLLDAWKNRFTSGVSAENVVNGGPLRKLS